MKKRSWFSCGNLPYEQEIKSGKILIFSIFKVEVFPHREL